MKTIARALFLSLSLLVTVAATGCVEAIDTNPAASEDVALAADDDRVADELAPALSDDEGGGDQGQAPAPPIPAPPPPLCNNGNAPGGQMIMPGWTCEIRVGSNLCCDTNRNLICARTGKIPFGTECVVNPNPNPNPNPSPIPSPIPTPIPSPIPSPSPSPDGDLSAPSTDVRAEQVRTAA